VAVLPIGETAMTFSIRARYALALAWLLAPSAPAAAGDLGPTSRGTVSISITIPPHVRVSRPAGSAPSDLRGLCVDGIGLGEYRVRILNAAGSQLGQDMLPGRLGGCASLGATAIANAAVGPAESGPMTLLIVPD
jgi:hypothetical protein